MWRSNQLSYRTGFKLSAQCHAPSSIDSLSKNRTKRKQTRNNGYLKTVTTATEANHMHRNYALRIMNYALKSILSRKEVLPDLLDFAEGSVRCVRKPFQDSPERRCSSRTFRYGYLVTT